MLPESYRLGGLTAEDILPLYLSDFNTSSEKAWFERNINDDEINQEEILKNTEDSSRDMEEKKHFEEEKRNSYILSLK